MYKVFYPGFIIKIFILFYICLPIDFTPVLNYKVGFIYIKLSDISVIPLFINIS